MPTQTFWNLPADKRQAIIDIAVEEFAEHSYTSASISRIVARAGIAKGSIYQYFQDKQELFLYLLDLSNQKRLEFLSDQPPPASNPSIFQTLRWQMSSSTRAALAYPQLTRLFYRALDSNLPFHDEVMQRMRATGLEYLRQFIKEGIAQGQIDSSVDPDLAAIMINGLLSALGPLLIDRLKLDPQLPSLDHLPHFDSPEVERMFDAAIAMLEHGLAPRLAQSSPAA